MEPIWMAAALPSTKLGPRRNGRDSAVTAVGVAVVREEAAVAVVIAGNLII
jgi:hypothetical protein